MEDVFEYRLGGRNRTIWMAGLVVACVITVVVQNESQNVAYFVSGLLAVLIIWMLTSKPTAGIRVDDQFLTLAAWRKPKQVPLASIDHLRMVHWTDDSDLIVVYRDGTEEEIPNADLPPVQLMSEVLADRGIAVRDPIS